LAVTLEALARRLGGQVKGDPSVEIHAVMSIEEAVPGSVTFLANPKYFPKLETTRASAIIVSPDLADLDRNLILVENPYLAFAHALGFFAEQESRPEPGIQPGAVVHPEAQVGEGVTICGTAHVEREATLGDGVVLYPGVYVDRGCEIGAKTVIFPNTVLYPRSVIGRQCVIHANCTIGSPGFGYAPDGQRWEHVPQVCRAIIGDDVEIGANSVVNRGGARDTIIGRGTKVDSFVIIAHGVHVGEDCLFVSQVGISGTVTIGAHCTFAGQVGVAGHLTIGDSVQVGAQAGVKGDLAANKKYLGQPAIELAKARRVFMTLPRLPEMKVQLRELQRTVAQLEAQVAALGHPE
jgi:UDP-3-O-[3-hydroxymyristoyl] glucosamine N-acyltransferase